MDCTWPEFTVVPSTEFDRFRPVRKPGPALLRDVWGLRIWGFRMDATNGRDRAKVVAAAMEINRQRAAGEDLRCDCCGFFQKRWEMEAVTRDGVERFQCGACAHASLLGFDSRLELGAARVEMRA